jgi:hypothetical protein
MTARKYPTEAERASAMRAVGLKAAEEKTGIHAEGYDASQDKSLGGQATFRNQSGVFAATPEQRTERGKLAGLAGAWIYKIWATHYGNHVLKDRPRHGKPCIFCDDSELAERLLSEERQKSAERKRLKRRKEVS